MFTHVHAHYAHINIVFWSGIYSYSVRQAPKSLEATKNLKCVHFLCSIFFGRNSLARGSLSQKFHFSYFSHMYTCYFTQSKMLIELFSTEHFKNGWNYWKIWNQHLEVPLEAQNALEKWAAYGASWSYPLVCHSSWVCGILWSFPEALQCRKWLQPNILDTAV